MPLFYLLTKRRSANSSTDLPYYLIQASIPKSKPIPITLSSTVFFRTLWHSYYLLSVDFSNFSSAILESCCISSISVLS